MEGTIEHEFLRFIKVWLAVFACLTYCYFISTKIPKGFFRLLSVLPIVCIFTFLPLSLSTMIFGSPTGFMIGWFSNFNLLLLAFDKGPLSSSNMSLLRFISFACLPIKIKQNPSPQTTKSSQNGSEKEISSSTKSPKIINETHRSPLYYSIQVLVMAAVLQVYKYKDQLHPTFIVLLYCVIGLTTPESFFALIAVLAKFLMGLEVEPQFNYPFLTTSLQDFWGRRWNLMVSGLIRISVYDPLRSFCTRNLGRWWGRTLGVLASFVVSGLMHEFLFFYMGRLWPTWEVTWSFFLQGVCVVLEIDLKKACKGRFQLHRFISGPLTIAFIVVTGVWLYFPVYGRVGVVVKMNEEIAILGEFAKGVAQKVLASVAG